MPRSIRFTTDRMYLQIKYVFAIILIVYSALFSCNSQSLSNNEEPVSQFSNTSTVKDEKSFSDLDQLLSLTINLDELQTYYHVKEIPERKPLVILKNHFVQHEPELTKFGMPVKFIEPSKIEKRSIPYLEITKVEIHKDSAVINFLYPVEGIVGTVNFSRRDNTWHIENFNLVER